MLSYLYDFGEMHYKFQFSQHGFYIGIIISALRQNLLTILKNVEVCMFGVETCDSFHISV